MSENEKLQLMKLIIDPMPLYEKNFPVVFFWSPKSGCTSLVKWYLYQIELLDEALAYDPWVHKYRAEVYQRRTDYLKEVNQNLIDGSKDTYKLVRNPYRRAVSSFLSVVTNPDLMKKIAPDFTDGLSFKEFLYIIKSIGVSSSKIDRHVAEQYVQGEELIIKNVIQLENFSTEIAKIERKYGLLPAPLPTITQSPHHASQKMTVDGNECFANVKMTMEKAGNPLPSFNMFYDNESKEIVQELFKKDFEAYGYCKCKLK